MKTCRVCKQSKPLTDFYAHPAMKDGRLNDCKPCHRESVAKNRRAKIDYYRKRDRDRSQQPQRVLLRRVIAKRYAAAHPDRKTATNALNNALRDGRIVPQPCWVCGVKAEAHHPDYSRPLDVVWLCKIHHEAAHQAAKTGEA